MFTWLYSSTSISGARATATLLLMVVFMSACRDGGSSVKTESVTIAGETFTLELAADDDAREWGLKLRGYIPDHGGMLFVFPDSQVRSFWMHRCLVDIDVIYLDSRGAVTATHRMKTQGLRRSDETEADYQSRMRQTTYPSRYPAQFAIELQAGWLDQLNLKVDDRIELDLGRLKGMAR